MGESSGPQGLTVVSVPGGVSQARQTISLNFIFLTYKIEAIFLLLPCSAVTLQAEHCVGQVSMLSKESPGAASHGSALKVSRCVHRVWPETPLKA